MSTLTNAHKHSKRRMKKNGRNVLKFSKSHLEPSGGKNECLDTFKKAIGGAYLYAHKEKSSKNFTSFLDPPCLAEWALWRASWRVIQYSSRCARMCALGPPEMHVACATRALALRLL